MARGPDRSAATRRWRWVLLALLATVGGLGALLMQQHLQRARVERRLLSSYPQDVTADPALVRFAVAQGKPLFVEHCAACHGAEMQGNTALGAPNLRNGDWLWGNGTVFQIERIILFGIRSGHGKALDTDDMPAYGLMGRLTDGQIQELVQYIMKLNRRPYDAEAANAGEALFHSPQVNCWDCHGSDARGVADYGAPNLTVNTWNNGGDARAIYDSIYYGRHRIMPAWRGILSLEQIRALAVYVYTMSHPVVRSADSQRFAPVMR